MSRLSVKTPLLYDDTDGPYQACHNMEEVAFQNLKSLALTNPGERIWEPNFGMGLRKKLFEHDTQSLRTSLRSTIKQQIAAYLPYIKLLGVNFSSKDDPGATLGISLSYAIVTGASKSEKQQIVFGVSGVDSSKTDAYAALDAGQIITAADLGSLTVDHVVASVWED
tara:strand:+ start:2733 stop:3233 length:501 start_codon:yes stop_codon:yes gene_type:complete